MTSMTPEEARFDTRRKDLSARINECVLTAEQCLGLMFTNSEYHVDFLSGERTFATSRDQQFVQAWEWKTPAGLRRLNITIGHTGPNLDAFVTITTNDGFSERIPDPQTSFPMRPVIVGILKRFAGVA